MKKCYLFASLLVIMLSTQVSSVLAQDTTWVQTYTFDTLWTRRAKFNLPTQNEQYRKILMYFTIKCYNGVSGDGNYPCGEWDGIWPNNVYDHRGKLDSTVKRGYDFMVHGMNNIDTLQYSSTPQYDIFKSYLYNTIVDNITSSNNYTVGAATTAMPHPFNLATGNERSQFIWKASELTAAGLSAGNITGIKLNFQGNNSVLNNLHIRIKQIPTDSFDVRAMIVDTLTSSYHFNRIITTAGFNNFQFNQPFVWNGTSNLLIDFSYENTGTSGANLLMGANTANASGLYSTTGNYSLAAYNNIGGQVRFDSTLNMFSGNAPRTYEMWIQVDSFQTNGSAFFSAGKTSTNNDFTFYQIGAANNYKFNYWSANDIPFAGPNLHKVWKHIAVTYGNDTTRIYFNGTLVKTKKTTNVNTLTDRDFYLGSWGDSYHFLGKFSHLRIWDKALTQNQIKNWIGHDIDPTNTEYSHLKADYRMNTGSGYSLNDMSSFLQHNGKVEGNIWWKTIKPKDYYYNAEKLYWRPQIQFERNTYTSHIDSVEISDTVYNDATIVDFYGNPANNKIVNDNDPLNPAYITSTESVWSHKYTYIYKNGVAIDSIANTLNATIYNHPKIWYSNTVEYEIGSSISPYGIQLNLGEGRTRIYDVTDYYQILQDTVDLEVGKDWELQDVKFAFIKGEPAAEVLRISQPWMKGRSAISYNRLAADLDLAPKTITLDPNTNEIKMRSIITGHGGSESAGPNFPNGCCEFYDNTHYFKSNGQTIHSFKIFREDCDVNPIFPQGGTWVYDREGWCPGDIIKPHDFNVTSYKSGGQINLDYQPAAIPTGNENLGNGVYHIALQVIEYGTPGRNNDAEIYDIIKPSDAFAVSRVNPICHTPQVVIRNSGKNALTSTTIKYKVSGGVEASYSWTGNLKFLDTALVDLPISSSNFWNGDQSNKFIVYTMNPNGVPDEYFGNDTSHASFNMPDILPGRIIVKFKTNSRPAENTLTIKNETGATVFTKTGLTANTTYNDTLALPIGCYTFVLDDAGSNGLTWWAATQQGSGNIAILNANNGTNIKSFNSDFGAQIFYSFSVTEPLGLHKINFDNDVALFPNPNTGDFTIQLQGFSGEVDIELVNALGQSVLKNKMKCLGSKVTEQFKTGLPAGVYLLNMSNNNNKATRKIVIE